MAVGVSMPTFRWRMCQEVLARALRALDWRSCRETLRDDARAALNGSPAAPAQPGGCPGTARSWPTGTHGDAASTVKRAVVAHPVSLSQLADAHTHRLPAAELRGQCVDAGA